jgi:hypothetical protein
MNKIIDKILNLKIYIFVTILLFIFTFYFGIEKDMNFILKESNNFIEEKNSDIYVISMIILNIVYYIKFKNSIPKFASMALVIAIFFSILILGSVLARINS